MKLFLSRYKGELVVGTLVFLALIFRDFLKSLF
jgi:hypothetical protein